MNNSVFVEIEFLLLIFFSLILPIGIYGYMMWKRSISRITVLVFGNLLIAIAVINVFLLQRLAEMAKITTSLMDDQFFRSELSIALYLIPVVFAGIGVNIISHILVSHLAQAEKEFDRGMGKK
jgi:uncharacterized metal-binding protein